MVDSAFHLYEVDHTSTSNFWELNGKKDLTQSMKKGHKVFFKVFLIIDLVQAIPYSTHIWRSMKRVVLKKCTKLFFSQKLISAT